jgi:protoporphyrinogen/coproporphyrinogen III oxidase
MEKRSTADIIVIGAGLTGLTSSFYLKKKGFDVVIIEKNDRTGGVVQTYRENGFIFEGGPNTGVLSHPEVAELFGELNDHCKLEVANPEAKKRLIWKSGMWHALPSGLISAANTPLFTFGDKLRILGEPFRRKGSDNFETLESLVLRRLGRSFLDYAVDPFISGIYAGDPAKLVTRYALPKLYALEQNYGSFIIGAVKKSFEPQDDRMRKATKEVFSAVGGLGSLTDGLAAEIGSDRIYLNAENTVIHARKEGYLVSTRIKGNPVELAAPVIISTVDAGLLPSLFPFMQGEDLSAITNLEYSGVIQVILGFRKWKGMDLRAFGGLVPSREKRNILGVLFTSSFLKERAPAGGALLSVFVGGFRRPELLELSDSEIKELVFAEVVQMLGVTDPDPEILRIFRYKRAIPQYGKSSPERLEAIKRMHERYKGLHIAGAVRDGIGMADRIRQARTIAEEIADNPR